MKIKYFPGHEFKEESYIIIVRKRDKLEPEEIFECFKSQYPNTNAVILFNKADQIQIGMFILGLNLKNAKKI